MVVYGNGGASMQGTPWIFCLPCQIVHLLGIAYGSDLRFWIEAARFCLELLTRQCFVPALHEVAQGRTVTCRADWEVFLSPEDGERMQRIARQMPPICWSFVPLKRETYRFYQILVQHFLNQSVDAFVRESLSAQSLLPGQAEWCVKLLQEQWVQALSSADSHLYGTSCCRQAIL